MKKRIALLLLAALLLGLTACGSRNPQTQGKVTASGGGFCLSQPGRP